MELTVEAELQLFSISAPVGKQLSLYLPTVAAQFPATVQYGIPSVANITKPGISNATLNRWRHQYCNIFSIPLHTTYKWKLSIILLRIFRLCEECTQITCRKFYVYNHKLWECSLWSRLQEIIVVKLSKVIVTFSFIISSAPAQNIALYKRYITP